MAQELSQFSASKHNGPLAFFATEVKKALLLLVHSIWVTRNGVTRNSTGIFQKIRNGQYWDFGFKK